MDGSSMTEQTSQTNLKQAIKYPERKINDWFTAHHMMNVKQDILRAPHCGLTPRKSYRADLSSRVVRKGWPRDHYLHHDEMAERDEHLRRIQRIDEIMRRSSPSVLHEDYPFSIRRILETDTTELVEPVRPHDPSIHPRDVSRHDYLEQRTVYAPPIHRQRTTSRHEQDFESYCNVDGCSKCGVTYPRYRAIPHPFLDLSRHRQPTISTLNTERKDEKVFVPSHTDIKQQKQVKSKKHKVPSSRKRKRHRTAFTPTQLLGLENSFERGHYLVGDERRQLAQFLRLSETQIKVWFQNRRTKWKRQRNALFEGTDLSDESDVSEIDE